MVVEKDGVFEVRVVFWMALSGVLVRITRNTTIPSVLGLTTTALSLALFPDISSHLYFDSFILL